MPDERIELIEAIRKLAAVIARTEDVGAIIQCIEQIDVLGKRLAGLGDDPAERNR